MEMPMISKQRGTYQRKLKPVLSELAVTLKDLPCVNYQKFWIIRVGDGLNFVNSNFPFWGSKRGKHGNIKSLVKKINVGDILCFITPKPYGGKVIGMATYTGFYDRIDEPLLSINTKSNEDQNWVGGGLWDIQIHYSKLYITEKENILVSIQHCASILEYEKYKPNVKGDLYELHKKCMLNSTPKIF